MNWLEKICINKLWTIFRKNLKKTKSMYIINNKTTYLKDLSCWQGTSGIKSAIGSTIQSNWHDASSSQKPLAEYVTNPLLLHQLQKSLQDMDISMIDLLFWLYVTDEKELVAMLEIHDSTWTIPHHQDYETWNNTLIVCPCLIQYISDSRDC